MGPVASSSQPRNRGNTYFGLWIVETDNNTITVRRGDVLDDSALYGTIREWLTAPNSTNTPVVWHYPLVPERAVDDGEETPPSAWLVVTKPASKPDHCCESRLIVDFNTDPGNDWTVSRLMKAFCTPCTTQQLDSHPQQATTDGDGVIVPYVDHHGDRHHPTEPPRKRIRRWLNDRTAGWRRMEEGEGEGAGEGEEEEETVVLYTVDPIRAYFGQQVWKDMYQAEDLRLELHGHLLGWGERRRLNVASNWREGSVTPLGWHFKLDDVHEFLNAVRTNHWSTDNVVINVTYQFEVNIDLLGCLVNDLRVRNLMLYSNKLPTFEPSIVKIVTFDPYLQNGGSLFLHRHSLGRTLRPPTERVTGLKVSTDSIMNLLQDQNIAHLDTVVLDSLDLWRTNRTIDEWGAKTFWKTMFSKVGSLLVVRLDLEVTQMESLWRGLIEAVSESTQCPREIRLMMKDFVDLAVVAALSRMHQAPTLRLHCKRFKLNNMHEDTQCPLPRLELNISPVRMDESELDYLVNYLRACGEDTVLILRFNHEVKRGRFLEMLKDAKAFRERNPNIQIKVLHALTRYDTRLYESKKRSEDLIEHLMSLKCTYILQVNENFDAFRELFALKKRLKDNNVPTQVWLYRTKEIEDEGNLPLEIWNNEQFRLRQGDSIGWLHTRNVDYDPMF